MKLNTLEMILNVLKNENHRIEIRKEIGEKALISLERMLELAE